MDGKHTASDISWPDPIKYLNFVERGVEVKYESDGSKIFVSARRPTKGFVFSEKQGVRLSDNGFDLVPTETKVVTVEGGDASQLEWRYVGSDQ